MNERLRVTVPASMLIAVVALLFPPGCTKAQRPDNSLLANVAPLQRGSATMSLGRLDKLMHENVLIVTDVRKLPESVKASFCNIEQCNFVGLKFDMVNPGEAMSTDYIIAGVPNKQLRFAALNSDSAIVFYESGGIANQLRVTAFDFRERTSWGASLKVFRVTTLEQLRAAISDRQFTQWSPGDRR